jgi:hypothetical protein
MRSCGATCDNLVSAQVVTADGRVRRASEAENPDLFWALRGGGGNFGVVTEFEFRLHDVGPMLNGGILAFAPESGGKLLRAYREWADRLPDEIGTLFAYLNAPPLPFVPEELHFQPTYAVLISGIASEEATNSSIAELRPLGTLFELAMPMPYTMVQALSDAGNPWAASLMRRASISPS